MRYGIVFLLLTGCGSTPKESKAPPFEEIVRDVYSAMNAGDWTRFASHFMANARISAGGERYTVEQFVESGPETGKELTSVRAIPVHRTVNTQFRRSNGRRGKDVFRFDPVDGAWKIKLLMILD